MKNIPPDLISKLELHPPPSQELMDQVQAELELTFPEDYLEFMAMSNGAEGWVGPSYLALWDLEEIVERIDGLQIKERAPHLVFFAGDGGAEGYAFDKRTDPVSIIEVDYISIGSEEETYFVASSFVGFLEVLATRYYPELNEITGGSNG